MSCRFTRQEVSLAVPVRVGKMPLPRMLDHVVDRCAHGTPAEHLVRACGRCDLNSRVAATARTHGDDDVGHPAPHLRTEEPRESRPLSCSRSRSTHTGRGRRHSAYVHAPSAIPRTVALLMTRPAGRRSRRRRCPQRACPDSAGSQAGGLRQDWTGTRTRSIPLGPSTS